MATVVVIGAGPNGLVAAAILSREGHDVVVLERRRETGGAMALEDVHPGYRCPLQSGVGGTLLPRVAEALGTDGGGAGAAPLVGLGPDGTAVIVENDQDVRALGGTLSARDVAGFSELTATVARLARVLAPLLTTAPPSIEAPQFSDLITLAATGRRFRALGRRNGFRLLQWAPMPIADLTCDRLDDPLLRAMIGARGIFGRLAGPRSAGTSLELLLHAARTGWVVAGGPRPSGAHEDRRLALTRAAERAGVRVRTSAPVDRALVDAGRATGVRLASGEALQADVVVSSADPSHTFLSLVDAAWLPPEFVGDVQQIRTAGVVSKVHLALSGLPAFTAFETLANAERERLLAGRLQIGSTLDDLERAYDAAKYGTFSEHPYIELTLPSLHDASLAPPGHHVLSAHVQFTPYKLRDGSWDTAREALADAVIDAIEAHAPGLRGLIVARQVVTPEDLERRYGLTGGHMYHGEHALDQLFVMRPVYGWANYRTPIRGLYLCGAGTHPGGGVHGACGFNAAHTIVRDLRDGRA